MTARERVLKAITHRETRETPFSWGLGITPEMASEMDRGCRADGYAFKDLRRATEDIRTIEPPYVGPPLPQDVDIWGIRRKAVSYGAGHYDEVTYNPLCEVESPDGLDEFTWPTPDWFDFRTLGNSLKKSDPDHMSAHRLSILCSGNPLEIYTWMTGMEQTFVNLLVNKDIVHAALDRITNHFVTMMDRAAEESGDYIDIFYFADDLGGQNTLLISPETYREMVQPYHQRLAAHAKSLLPDAKAMFHTDGAVFDIIPDLLDAGMEILEAVQTDAAGMEPRALKDTYGDRLGFHGGISVQRLLPDSTAERVHTECRRMMEILGEQGGYVAAASHAVQGGTPPENVHAMLKAVLGEARYQGAIDQARALATD